MRRKRVGALQSSQFLSLVFLPLCAHPLEFCLDRKTCAWLYLWPNQTILGQIRPFLFLVAKIIQIAWLKIIFFPFGCSTRVLKNCYLLPSCTMRCNGLNHIMNSHLSFYILTFSSWKLITPKVTVNKLTILYDEEASYT